MEYSKMKTALTIAGSDSSGGAGIQADIKTMTMNGVYAMSAITALTAQNTIGISAISEVTPEFLGQQIDAVFTDIFPDAVKTGMVANEDLIEVIADRLAFYGAKNIVIDPVMIATSGARLISENAVAALKEKLLPSATVVTPNIPEAEVLSGMKIADKADMEKAAKLIEGLCFSVLVGLQPAYSLTVNTALLPQLIGADVLFFHHFPKVIKPNQSHSLLS